jgi:D-lactate dehydrogenase
MKDIKFYETFREEKELLKTYLPAKITASFTHKTIQEEGEKKPPARFICIRTQSNIPQSWIGSLDAILSRSQGYDHLLPIVTKNKHIHCGYIGDYCSKAVAEHAVLTMWMLLRQMKTQIQNFNSFHRENMSGIECADKNVLVVGVGNIGQEIVKIAKKLNMNVRGVDFLHKVKNLKYVSLQQGLPWADIVFCALPLTDRTVNLLNYNVLKRIRPPGHFINVSRGEISPIKDLKRLINEHKLSGLSLDVYENEKDLATFLRNPKRNQARISQGIRDVLFLKDQSNVIFTPHNAFNTVEALDRKCRQTADEAYCFLKTKTFRWPVHV